MEKNIHTFIGCDSEYDESKIVIFGAPFDSTTSYRPGTRFASSAMRNESFGIETYSPYQDKDLTDIKVFDGGDLELCFGSPESALNDIENFSSKILGSGKLPCMIGGEHLVTLGAVRAAVKKYPDLHIIHFDAHADLRDDYLGQKLSHACVMRRCHELVGDGKIFQFGIRSGDREEFLWGKNHVTTNKFDFTGLEKIAEKIQEMKNNDINVREFERIKKKIYGDYAVEYNNVADIGRMFTSDYIKGINSFEYMDKFEEIDAEYAKQVLKEIFTEDKMIMSVIKGKK